MRVQVVAEAEEVEEGEGEEGEAGHQAEGDPLGRQGVMMMIRHHVVGLTTSITQMDPNLALPVHGHHGPAVRDLAGRTGRHIGTAVSVTWKNAKGRLRNAFSVSRRRRCVFLSRPKSPNGDDVIRLYSTTHA